MTRTVRLELSALGLDVKFSNQAKRAVAHPTPILGRVGQFLWSLLQSRLRRVVVNPKT
jgi:hypothetical protein